MDSSQLATYAVGGLVALALFKFVRRSPLDDIPVIGPPGFIGSYFGAYQYLHHAQEMVQEGFDKYRNGMFRVPFFWRWVVVVSGPQLVDDIRQASEDDLSMQDAGNEMTLQTDYNLGRPVREDRYHIKVVHSTLTRNFGNRFPEVRDELVAAFNDAIVLNGNEWKSIPALDVVRHVICRASNRLFVGLPLCRNPEYEDLNIKFAIEIHNSADRISLFPKFLWPIVGPLSSPLRHTMARASKIIGPLVEERLRLDNTYGNDWPDRPNDLLSWLLDEAKGERRTVYDLSLRVLLVNFVSIHTSSSSFGHALYHLAAEPWYLEPLREEVEAAIEQEGWSKAALNKMRKIDSFLRESQRMNGLNAIGLDRVVRKPGGFKFSNGVTLPKGTYVAVASYATHHNDESYVDANRFDGFRFSNMRQDEGESIKHQLISTDDHYLAFGHGKYACPGRFFAANEMKAMLAHVVLNYDVKFENEGVRPKNIWHGSLCIPDPTVRVLFRKRQT